MKRLLCTLAVFLLSPAVASAATAERDLTFGAGGEFKLPGETVRAVALQPDGKLVLAGEGLGPIGRVHRLNRDGTPDLGFGDQGSITIDDPTGSDRMRAVLVQPDGRILVGGASAGRAVLHRYDERGKPDAGFGTGGRAMLTTATVTEQVNALALAPDGRIVAAGETFEGLGDAVVWRRHGADGAPDVNFNAGGRIAVGLPPDTSELATGVAVQPDGKIVIAGNTTAGTDMFVARLEPVQGLDATFRGGGKFRLDSGGGEFANTVVLQNDGKLIVAGRTTVGGNGVVHRLLSSGQPDPAFNAAGVQFIDSAADETIRAVLVQPDRKLVLAGATTAGTGGGDAAFYRLTEDGQMDRSFDFDGAIGADSGAMEALFGAVQQPDGNIVGVGSSGGDGVVYRRLGDPHTLTVRTAGNGSVTSEPVGIACPAVCVRPFDVGTSLVLVATPGPGARFDGWSGVDCLAGTAARTCIFALHAPVTATATFAPIPPATAEPVVVGRPTQRGVGVTEPPRDRTAPRITRARIVKRTARFTLSEPATTTATIKLGRRVVAKATSKTNTIALRKKLKRGRYTVVLVATDRAGNRSAPVTLRMRVV